MVSLTADLGVPSWDSILVRNQQAQQDAMLTLWQHALIAQHNQFLTRQHYEIEAFRSRLFAVIGAPPGLDHQAASASTCDAKVAGQACWDQSTTCSSSQRSHSPGASSGHCDQSVVASDQQELTTMIIRNVLGHCTREMLIDFMDHLGFHGKYNLLYLPRCFTSQLCFHYAFVNFISDEVAVEFQTCAHGFADSQLFGESVADVSLSQCQGLQANIAKYRNSSVMHHSVPDDCKPLMFRDGQPVAFPAPTKRIKEDRRARRAAEERCSL
jgi:hypothetical protein